MRVKPQLKRLHTREIQNINQQTDSAKTELKVVQEHLSMLCSDGIIIEEKAHWIWRSGFGERTGSCSKSLVRGGLSLEIPTQLFSAVMKLRAQRKQISEIMSLSGTKHTTLEDAQTEIVTVTRFIWVLQLLATCSRQIDYEKGTYTYSRKLNYSMYWSYRPRDYR